MEQRVAMCAFLQTFHLCGGFQHRADLTRERPRLLRRRGDVCEHRLNPGRTELYQVEPKIAERQPRVVELTRECGAALHEVLERAPLPPKKRELLLAFRRRASPLGARDPRVQL